MYNSWWQLGPVAPWWMWCHIVTPAHPDLPGFLILLQAPREWWVWRNEWWGCVVCKWSTTCHCKTCFFSPERIHRSCQLKTHIPLLQLIRYVPHVEVFKSEPFLQLSHLSVKAISVSENYIQNEQSCTSDLCTPKVTWLKVGKVDGSAAYMTFMQEAGLCYERKPWYFPSLLF